MTQDQQNRIRKIEKDPNLSVMEKRQKVMEIMAEKPAPAANGSALGKVKMPEAEK
jgi:hypothetical protein